MHSLNNSHTYNILCTQKADIGYVNFGLKTPSENKKLVSSAVTTSIHCIDSVQSTKLMGIE